MQHNTIQLAIQPNTKAEPAGDLSLGSPTTQTQHLIELQIVKSSKLLKWLYHSFSPLISNDAREERLSSFVLIEC